jgi:hypothetical protein
MMGSAPRAAVASIWRVAKPHERPVFPWSFGRLIPAIFLLKNHTID